MKLLAISEFWEPAVPCPARNILTEIMPMKDRRAARKMYARTEHFDLRTKREEL